ncbi:MAG: NeuD/PglB/VioB family sugar acetyltransferase [Cyclobacteriaceae bacterium]|nr:NeuD/PglB/VioB family sugar acetyltransferase [Cyclobacteriaceae bacterium]
MNKPVIILCATNLGKAVLEIFKSNDVVVFGFLDDDKKLHGTEIEDISVLGSTDNEEYLKILGKDCDVFVASDDNSWKATMIKSLRKNQKSMPVNAIHSDANIAKSAILHHGSLYNQGVTIGANTEIGNHCIIHSGSIVDFGVKVGDFVQIGAGSIINSGAVIEDGAFVGSGVTIVSGVTIGEGARIGAGSVVIADVGKNETVFGNPAKAIE